jgi:hypothetical protein
MGPETVVGLDFSQPNTEFLDIPHKSQALYDPKLNNGAKFAMFLKDRRKRPEGGGG